MSKSKQELRIEIATAAMQGLIAADVSDHKSVELLAEQAVACADALIAKLFDS